MKCGALNVKKAAHFELPPVQDDAFSTPVRLGLAQAIKRPLVRLASWAYRRLLGYPEADYPCPG